MLPRTLLLTVLVLLASPQETRIKHTASRPTPVPPSDELSAVKHAYLSGEQNFNDRPASALAGVQPRCSTECTGVGADNTVKTFQKVLSLHA